MNRGVSDNSREKLKKYLKILKDNISSKTIKIPKNFPVLLRKIYKYLKPNINLIDINFNDLEEIDKERQYLLGIDDLWIEIKIYIKEWIFNMFSAFQNMIYNNETISQQLEFYLLNCFNLIKEVCRKPPRDLIQLNDKFDIKKELLYIILDYFIILNEKEIFEKVFNLILNYSINSNISYKYYVIFKKFSIKYYSQINVNRSNDRTLRVLEQNLISEIIDTSNNDYIEVNINKNKNDESFRKFIDFSITSLKTNITEENKSNKKSYFFSLFSKNKALISKELDGSNIMDFFTILNTCEEYSNSHLNNLAVFSVSYELLKFLYDSYKNNKDNYEMTWAVNQLKSVLHSYCIRIFEQSENYLESNKNKLIIDKNTQYNLNLIEACVWESLKLINLICKLDTSIVSNINMRMKQVYERIVLKQSGLVFLEILQFFIENRNLIIIDLDYYVSEFFKLKLKFNYKNEILSFTTLEFLYKNKEILNQKTQVFNSFFPLIIKIFATFPKYLDTKFFILINFMTKPTTIIELFNHILDLPAIILIIENFECYTICTENNSKIKVNIEDIFQPEYGTLINFLLRDEAFGKEHISNFNINHYDKQLKCIFDNLFLTARVNSTTKIVPKLMKKFFDVIIERGESESALETIVLIFERFSHFHENEHYKQEIRNLLIRKLEEIFKKWPNIIINLRERILYEIKNNYSNLTKRELICLLSWSLGEFLDIEFENSYIDDGIKETFECLEKLLRDKIRYFSSGSKNESSSQINEESVEDLLKWYSTYFIDKTSEEEISNERLLIIIINTLGKLAIKFKSYVSRTIKCFKDINFHLSNKNLSDKLYEMLTSLQHISISTEYLV